MEIRRVKANEFEQAIQLADKTFRKEGHISMGEAFPQVFSNDLQLSYGAFDGEKLVSFIGLVPSKIHVGESVLNVFSIGAVCTEIDYRNQGISSAILKEIYDYIDKAEATLLFVSGDRGLYLRNQCDHFGRVSKYSIDRVSIGVTDDEKIRLAKNTDIFRLDQLRQDKRVSFENGIWEWKMLLEAGGFASIFKMKQALYVAEKNSILNGYAVIGLPTEASNYEHGIVTDWGGEPEAVHGILADLLQTNTVSRIEISVPWQDELNSELTGYKHEIKKNGGTVYIVNAGRLIEQLGPYFREKGLTQELEVTQIEDGNVLLKIGEIEKTLTNGILVELLFGFESDIRELNGVFPVPLPGLEGINYV
ncbi:GNAT family N-acetyltransferase [Oceanobacillus chungangensis]|uniref:N-acetyltransferase domain-containing protein n=1 Tax=Oceanobacillus chungangensis TaxID=1229152 RepID=A0A3D8PZ86_9BACI|nr:GNAT family N-acetyltransferase [Oceanobacillus chungangensis]RDW20661.1 hypothetical protein CWR45_05385 [Oceanobacillus chungangensis]